MFHLSESTKVLSCKIETITWRRMQYRICDNIWEISPFLSVIIYMFPLFLRTSSRNKRYHPQSKFLRSLNIFKSKHLIAYVQNSCRFVYVEELKLKRLNTILSTMFLRSLKTSHWQFDQPSELMSEHCTCVSKA